MPELIKAYAVCIWYKAFFSCQTSFIQGHDTGYKAWISGQARVIAIYLLLVPQSEDLLRKSTIFDDF